MSGFQIPGLTTLSQPSAAAAPTPVAADAAAAGATETHQDEKSATKSPDHMMVDRPDSIQDSHATAVNTSIPKHAEESREDTSENMAVDQTQTQAQAKVQTQDTPLETTSDAALNKQDHNQEESTEKVGDASTEAPPSPPSLTSGLEALLGGLDPAPVQPEAPTQNGDNSAPAEEANGEQEHPEWEEDSSPLESSSEESSSDSDDDSDDDKDYPILGPEETARLLMEMEGGSDDEGEGRARSGGSGGQVRTKNELPEEIIPVPDIKLEADAKIVELGNVEHIVENTIVVCANTTGEYQVLDSGSAIFTEGRTVIGAVADLLGSVRQPRYTVRFTNAEQIVEHGLELGTKLFYSADHATYIFTQALQGEKGTDASNWHDEEAGDEEMEFSDDEKEAEYKRQLKAKKKARGGKEGGRGGARPPESSWSQPPVALKYDDDDDDGPYKPLARPPGFGQGPPPPHSVETGYNNYSSNRGAHNNRGRGRGNRGRGNRGGQRGGGGGGGGRGGGFSLPPRPQGQNQHHHQPQPQQQSQYQPQAHQPQPQPQQPSFNFPFGQTPQFPFPWPPNLAGLPPPPPPPIPLPPQFTGQQQQQQAAGAGMFFNPAFYSAGAGVQWPGQQGPGQGQGHQGR